MEQLAYLACVNLHVLAPLALIIHYLVAAKGVRCDLLGESFRQCIGYPRRCCSLIRNACNLAVFFLWSALSAFVVI